MTQHAAPGRHRAAGRHNPLTEVAGLVARAGDTGIKASAVLAASGGLIAAFALPATAAPATASPQTSPAQRVATERVVKAAPALVAPGIQAPERANAFGLVGIKAVAKPEPAPVAPPAETLPAASSTTTWQGGRSQQQTSRSATRSSSQTPQPQQQATRVPAATGGVIGVAMSLLGIYYVYGGSTPAGFDCSGFTSYVFRQVGISLPRTAAAQQAAATPVSNPQPGDLVFFGYPAYHVGIYAGNGMMIDSPRTGAATSVRAIWDSRATFGRP